MSARLSVVIPTLDEQAALPRLLEQLRAQTDIALQIVVADGGSSDGTRSVAQEAGVALVSSARGRGRQMNAGARATHGDWLLFLHADSELRDPRLLSHALAALQQAIDGAGHDRIAGHFALRFVRTQPGHERFFHYLEGKTRSGRRYTINGDQGLLISRRWFEALGGFDESLPFLEDALLGDRIFLEGRWLLLPGELWTSARRFEREGHAERYTLMAITMGLLAGGLREFFEQAPETYRAQAQAERLRLAPFRTHIRTLLRARPPGARLGIWYRVGRFVRQNAWQLAYRRDVLRDDGRCTALARHDRWCAPLIDNALGDLAAMLLVWLWFHLVLPRGAGRAPR